MKDDSNQNNFLDFDENKNGQKFVQVYLENTPYFQFISVEEKHSQALEKFLQKFNVKYETENFSGERIPTNQGRYYQLVGAGRCLKMKNYFQITGTSSEYNLEPNKKHFEETLKPSKIKFE